MNSGKKHKTTRLLRTVLLLSVMVSISVACGTQGEAPVHQPLPQEQGNTNSTSTDVQDIGRGATYFLFEITDDDGNVSTWNINTDAITVGDALVRVGLIEGEQSEFGLMVLFVNGLRADYVEDGAWWAFYIDGEMAMEGVDTTKIEEGKTYAFIYTPA